MRRTDHASATRLAASCVALLALVYSACGAHATARPTATSTPLPTATATPVVLQGHITEQRVDGFPVVITTSPTDGSVWFTGARGVWQIGTSGSPRPQCCQQNSLLRGDTMTRLAIGADGTVWIAATDPYLAARIVALGHDETSGGVPIHPGSPIRLGPFATVGNSLWFVEEPIDPALIKIGHISAPGAIIAEYTVPLSAFVHDMTSGPDGAMWFTASTLKDGYIGRFTADGHATMFPIPTANSDPYGIRAGPDGALWFTELVGNKIGRITTDGHITEFPLPAHDGSPAFITVGPDGALWFTEFNVAGYGRIGRITLQGAVTSFAVPTPKSGPVGITATADSLWFTEQIAGQIGHLT